LTSAGSRREGFAYRKRTMRFMNKGEKKGKAIETPDIGSAAISQSCNGAKNTHIAIPKMKKTL